MSKFSDLNRKGYILRENDGDPEAALEVFHQLLEIADGLEQRAEALAQLGLTHWHMGEFGKAKEFWAENLEVCEEAGEPGPLALAYRNMARPEISPEWKDQQHYGELAYQLATQADREDLVWFAHGNTTNAIQAGETSAAKQWLQIEHDDLQKHLTGEIKIENQNNVEIWHSGYLMNLGLLEGKRAPLEEALALAEKHSLSKRIEQIEAAMALIDSK